MPGAASGYSARRLVFAADRASIGVTMRGGFGWSGAARRISKFDGRGEEGLDDCFRSMVAGSFDAVEKTLFSKVTIPWQA